MSSILTRMALRNAAISTIAVLVVLCATGTAMAQSRVLWGNDAGAYSGAAMIEGVQLMGEGALSAVWDCPTSCAVDSVGVTLKHSGDSSTAIEFRVAVYDEDWNLMDTTAEQSFSGNSTTDWLIPLVNGFSAVAGTSYWGAVWGNSSAPANIALAFTVDFPAVTDTLRYDVQTYTTGAWLDPFNPSAFEASKRAKIWFIGWTVPASTISPRRRKIIEINSQGKP